MREVAADQLEFAGLLRPGEYVVCGHATGEPQTLTEALVQQRRDLGQLRVFVGVSFARTLQPEHIDCLRISGFGAIGHGSVATLAKAGALEIVPCHFGQVARYIADQRIRCDVALVQVSPPGPDGRYSYGVVHDYTPAAVAAARLVVAEVNDRVPWTYGTSSLGPDEIDVAVPTSRPVLELKVPPIGDVERAIAKHAASFVEDGTVLQMGIGAIPDAILQSLGDRKDLGVHSGMIGDAVVDLAESGALTNARKPIDRGVTITGSLMGTRRLYDWAHRNVELGMREVSYTHGDATLVQLDNLLSINSAVEIDLTGQVNAETANGQYIGGTGGQVDYVRAGQRSRTGRSLIAFASTARSHEASRIVANLSGPVTTTRTDVDVIVTEHGVADLRAQPIRERVRRLIAIAHPKFRERLEREAHDLFRRGY
jgi:acyl-CoA hydrolase